MIVAGSELTSPTPTPTPTPTTPTVGSEYDNNDKSIVMYEGREYET
jgi:hypothetical protein